MFPRVMIGMQTSSREGKCYLDITLHWDTEDPLNPVSGPVLYTQSSPTTPSLVRDSKQAPGLGSLLPLLAQPVSEVKPDGQGG